MSDKIEHYIPLSNHTLASDPPY